MVAVIGSYTAPSSHAVHLFLTFLLIRGLTFTSGRGQGKATRVLNEDDDPISLSPCILI